MVPAPDTNVFGFDAESYVTGNELIRVGDEDEDGLLPCEYAAPISGTTLLWLLELDTAHQAAHGSWLDDSDRKLESSSDSSAGSETSSDLDAIPDLIPSRRAENCADRYMDNVVVTRNSNDMSNLIYQVWIDGIAARPMKMAHSPRM